MGWKVSELEGVYSHEELQRAGFPLADHDEAAARSAAYANLEQDARANQVDLKRLEAAKDAYLAAAMEYYEARHVVHWGKDLEKRRARAEKLGDQTALDELDEREQVMGASHHSTDESPPPYSAGNEPL